MAEPIRVLIAFKDEERRSRAKIALRAERDLCVAGEAATGKEAADLAATHHPHLVLMDAGIEEPSSVEACRTIRSADPAVKVLLSGGLTATLHAAVVAGAAGTVSPEAEAEALHSTLRAVASGSRCVDAETVSSERARFARSGASLSRLDQRLVAMVAEGLRDGEIAVRLEVPEEAVQRQLRQILQALGVVPLAA